MLDGSTQQLLSLRPRQAGAGGAVEPCGGDDLASLGTRAAV